MRQLTVTLVLVLCLTSSTSALVEENSGPHWLKRTILVEERTAIWCPSCAEIDPELEIVAKSHGARTAIIGLHVDDEFENNASLARIQYQMQIDSEQYGTPTFFVDGVKTAEGYDAWSEVQKRILTQENSRESPEDMALEFIDGSFEIPTPEYGQITVMVLEHDKLVPEGADNPGEDTRDRVLIGMIVRDVSGNNTHYGDLSLPESWSVVMIHEPVEGGVPYGVVEISNLEYDDDKDNQLMIIVFTSIFFGALLVFSPTKKYLNSEEE